MPVDFPTIFNYFQQIGVFEYVLPFLLVFSLVFAVLEKTQILGKEKTNINVVVSIILGLLLIAQTQIVSIINTFIPKMSLFIIVVLMFFLVTGIFGETTKGWTGLPLVIAVIVTILAVIWALTPTIGLALPSWFQPTDQDVALMVLIAAIIAAIAYIGRKEKPRETFLEKLEKGLRGKE